MKSKIKKKKELILSNGKLSPMVQIRVEITGHYDPIREFSACQRLRRFLAIVWRMKFNENLKINSKTDDFQQKNLNWDSKVIFQDFKYSKNQRKHFFPSIIDSGISFF